MDEELSHPTAARIIVDAEPDDRGVEAFFLWHSIPLGSPPLRARFPALREVKNNALKTWWVHNCHPFIIRH